MILSVLTIVLGFSMFFIYLTIVLTNQLMFEGLMLSILTTNARTPSEITVWGLANVQSISRWLFGASDVGAPGEDLENSGLEALDRWPWWFLGFFNDELDWIGGNLSDHTRLQWSWICYPGGHRKEIQIYPWWFPRHGGSTQKWWFLSTNKRMLNTQNWDLGDSRFFFAGPQNQQSQMLP